MKKLLLASSVVILSGDVAAAERAASLTGFGVTASVTAEAEHVCAYEPLGLERLFAYTPMPDIPEVGPFPNPECPPLSDEYFGMSAVPYGAFSDPNFPAGPGVTYGRMKSPFAVQTPDGPIDTNPDHPNGPRPPSGPSRPGPFGGIW